MVTELLSMSRKSTTANITRKQILVTMHYFKIIYSIEEVTPNSILNCIIIILESGCCNNDLLML